MTHAAVLIKSQKIILFDAQCKLCSAWCHFIIAHDSQIMFKLCSVQSPKGQVLLTQHGFSTTDFSSMVYIENSQAFTQSHAFFEVMKQLGYPWKMSCIFSVLPNRFNNWLYDKIAANRYRLFGKYHYCRLPSQQDHAHYLCAL